MKKVCLYCRVSTALQEKEQTIKSQLSELREICKDFQVVKEYIDDGWSGANLDRPDLDRLRNDAKEGLFEAVYIHSADRLSRNLYHQGILFEELKKKNIELFIGDKPIADTPEGKFMFNILGAAAEYEKEKILERTRRGRFYKAKQKGVVGTCPPFGYDYVKKNSLKEGFYKINKKEAEVVKLIFQTYLRFKSLGKVVKELSLKNIKTRNGRNVWSRSEVGRILRREEYIGTGYYGKRYSIEIENGKKYNRVAKAGRRLRNRSEWIPLKFPPIIDKDVFRSVQDILSKRYKPYGQSKHFYLLSGLVRCGICGTTYSGDNTNGHFYYRCNNRHKTYPFPKECKARMVDRDRLEVAVWERIIGAMTNRRIITKHLSNLVDKVNENETTLKAEREKIVREKEKIGNKTNRLLEIYTDGSIDKTQFIEMSQEFREKGKALDERIQEINSKLGQLSNGPIFIKDIEHFCDLARQKAKNLTPDEKRDFLRWLVNEIIFDSNKKTARIIGQIPIGESGTKQGFVPKIGILSPLSQNASVRMRHLLLLQ